MSSYTQQGRWLTIQTPLGNDVLLIRGFSGAEELARLYHYELEMVASRDDIKPSDLIGKNVRIVIKFLDGTFRYYNGFVSRFTYHGTDDRLSLYTADVVPWLWFLTQTRNCRIFQNKSVKDIIADVFGNYTSAEFEFKLTGTHNPWEYCVQYRESDFDFISRLMEQEGIYYYFRQEENRHVMVMADSQSGYQDCAESEVTFAQNLSAADPSDKITRWDHTYAFKPAKATETDYNFEKPTASLRASTNTIIQLDGAPRTEVYDFPSEIEQKSDADAQVRMRMEEIEATYDIVRGASGCRTFLPGGRFTLTQHHAQAEAGKQYVLTSVKFEAHQSGAFVSNRDIVREKEYENTFTCIPATITYRPQRITPKPVIKGIQTAVVVGPSGEEIFCDKYGRVKVQFYWDRIGNMDEKSSCFIRVAQAIAGSGYGMVVLPRIGQEVIVQFLEGDPDRPLITGSVYNGEQMPPYALPDNQTRLVLKSNSSKGGGGYNELRLEDKKDSEHIFVFAQKDKHLRVKNDQFEFVGNEQHSIVKKDQFVQIEGVSNGIFKKDVVTEIDGEHNITVKSDHVAVYKASDHLSVTADRKVKVGASDNLAVTGALNIKSQAYSLNAQMNSDVKIGMNHALEAGMAVHLKAGMTMVIEAGAQLSLKVGGNFIDINPAGVVIQGTMVMINSGGAAGSGAGASPQDPAAPDNADPPKEAKEALDDQAGKTPAPAPAPDQPPKTDLTPAAYVLTQAAKDGTPFCEECAKEAEEDQEEADEAIERIKLVELVEVMERDGGLGTVETPGPASKKLTKLATRSDCADSGAYKQFINLDPDMDGGDKRHAEYGRVIRFRARVEWEDADKKDALTGKKVHFTSTLTAGSHRPGDLTDDEKEGFGSAGAAGDFSCDVDEYGWTDEVEFYTSRYGGDAFSIQAQAEEASDGNATGTKLEIGKYEVWRKLWYETDTMKDRSNGLLTMDSPKLPTIYKDVFIDLEAQGTDNQPDNTWNLESDKLHNFANKYFGADKSPYQAHELAIDHQADRADLDLEFTLVAKTYTHADADSYYVYDGGKSWIKSAKYDDGTGEKGLDTSTIDLVDVNKVYKQIKIDMSSGPVEPTPTKPVKVKLTVIKSNEWSGDGGSQPHALVAMGYWLDTETQAEALKRTLGTMAHELGHLVGMVSAAAPTFVDTGTGPHCSDTNCVMYYTNTNTRKNTFCDQCKIVLRRIDLSAFTGSFTHDPGDES